MANHAVVTREEWVAARKELKAGNSGRSAFTSRRNARIGGRQRDERLL